MKIIGWIVVIFATVLLAVLYRAWTITVLWGWFAPRSLAPLAMLNAVGIILLADLLKPLPRRDKEEKVDWEDILARGTAVAVLVPTMFLGFGWLFKTIL